MTTDAIRLLAPELLLVGMAVVLGAARAFIRARGCAAWLAAGALVVAGLLLVSPQTGESVGPSVARNISNDGSDAGREVPKDGQAGHGTRPGSCDGPLAGDAMARFGRWLALLVGLGLVLLNVRGRHADEPVYSGALLAAVAGLMLVTAARGLALLIVGFEGIAMATYVVLAVEDRDGEMAEVRGRHFLLGVLASVLWLYGLSFIYGMGGSTELEAIRVALSGPSAPGGAPDLIGLTGVAVVLLIVGLGFKITAIPLHFHTAEIHERVTYTGAAFLAIVPKVAGLLVLLRVLVIAAPVGALDACRLTMLLAASSMTYGNLMALRQHQLRRLLAYASIGQVGYLLLGVSVALAAGSQPMHWNPLAGVLFYLAVYSVALLGTYAALAYLGRADHPVDDVDELAGLSRTHPVLAASVTILLLSLAGVPPLAGFWANLALLAGAWEVTPATIDGATLARVWPIALAVLGASNMVVAAAYYARLVGVIYFRLPLATLRGEGGRAAQTVVLACALLTVGVGLHAGPLWQWTLRVGQEAHKPAERSADVVAPRR